VINGETRSTGLDDSSRGDDLYDYDAAAAHLLVSKRHVQRLVTDRRIAHIKMGRRTSFRLTDLESFIEVSRTPSKDRP
jgi:excisionase family DNA binding protein